MTKKNEILITVRDSLIGLILFLCVLLLVSCGTPPSATAFDPNLYAVQSQLTAEAAQDQARLYSVMATGTAQAPIMAITQTAAAQQINSTGTAQALAYQQQVWTATAQSVQSTETAAMTATAMSWTPTPNATMTAVFAQSYADATRVANEITLNNLQVERARDTNVAKMVILYGAAVVAMIMIVIGFYTYLKRMSITPQTVDERGRIIPIVNVLEGTLMDIERSANGMVSMKEKFFAQLPKITAERQAEVTTRAQLVDMATRSKLPMRLLNELQNREPLALPEPVAPLDTNFLLPSWDLMKAWDSKDGIPYYTARGMEIIDEKQYAHLAAIGATGAGKSRRFFRPVITCALAQGHRVVIIGKSADYWPFEAHPNATLLKVSKITEPGQAERYAKILEAIITEMNRRDDVLTAAHKSTWLELGLSQTFIVLDELGNALRLMDKGTSNQCRIWIEGLMSESRKVGFRMMIANQRATGMASILSQAGKAVFRVEQDEERHHRSLTGASGLGDGYYIARLGSKQKIAGAFEPTDEEIQQFLAGRPVDKVDDEDGWIDAVATDVPSLPERNQDVIAGPAPDAPEQKPANSLAEWVGTLAQNDPKGLKVLELIQMGGLSDTEIAEAAYTYSNGTKVRKVQNIRETYQGLIGATTTTKTTTTTVPNIPNLGTATA